MLWYLYYEMGEQDIWGFCVCVCIEARVGPTCHSQELSAVGLCLFVYLFV